MEAKRVRFKGPKIGINSPRRSRFDGCSAPAEAREDPLMPVADGGEPKTSEYAYFKRLKLGVGGPSRMNSAKRVSFQKRNFGPAYNGRESGDANIVKDHKVPMCAKKSSTLDSGSFLLPQDVAVHSAGMDNEVDDNTQTLGSTPGIRTPTTIDLDNILSTSTAASLNSGIQLKDGDIFSSKRRKLQRWIAKTLLLEADNHKLPKECDVVSLLMSRLLPGSSSKVLPSDCKIHKEPEVKCQEHLRDSSIEFEESWDGTNKLLHTDHFIGADISAAYREARPFCQINEDLNTFASIGADDMLVGFRDGNKQGYSLNEIDSKRWSDMFDVRNFLAWSNEHCDYSTQFETSSNIFKTEVTDQLCKGIGNDQSRKHTYELPTTCYDQLLENSGRLELPDCILDRIAPDSWHLASSERSRSSAFGNLSYSAGLNDFVEHSRSSCREYKRKRSDSELDGRAPDSWAPVSLETFRYSASGNFKGSAEMNEYEIRGEHSPLLLPWGTDGTNTGAIFTHNSDMDHEEYIPPWSEDDHYCLGTSASLGIYPSIFPSSFTPHLSSDILHNRYHWLQPKDEIARSRFAPFTVSYNPDQLSPDGAVLFKDVFRHARLYVFSEDHSDHTGNNIDDNRVRAAGAFLTAQDLDSDIGLRSESLSHCIKPQYDVHYDLRQRGPSSQVLYECGESHEMLPSDELSLMNVGIPAQPEFLFPLKLQRIRWLDTAVDTNYDDLQIGPRFG
ncbi:hypothetical protein vseg_003882 [Gypsophila vaccaria]